MIRRLAHLCFITDQLETMKTFYATTLGLSVKFCLKNADGQIFGYYFDCGDSSFIEIFDRVLSTKKWGGDLQPRTPGTQYRHFCLEVTGLADFCAQLQSRGLKVSEPRTGMDRSRQAWIADPDNNAIELMEYTHHSLQIQPSPDGTPGVAT